MPRDNSWILLIIYMIFLVQVYNYVFTVIILCIIMKLENSCLDNTRASVTTFPYAGPLVATVTVCMLIYYSECTMI